MFAHGQCNALFIIRVAIIVTAHTWPFTSGLGLHDDVQISVAYISQVFSLKCQLISEYSSAVSVASH